MAVDAAAHRRAWPTVAADTITRRLALAFAHAASSSPPSVPAPEGNETHRDRQHEGGELNLNLGGLGVALPSRNHFCTNELLICKPEGVMSYIVSGRTVLTGAWNQEHEQARGRTRVAWARAT